MFYLMPVRQLISNSSTTAPLMCKRDIPFQLHAMYLQEKDVFEVSINAHLFMNMLKV